MVNHYPQIEKTWNSKVYATIPKNLQEHIDESFRRSQKDPEQVLKNCRPHLPQVKWEFIIIQQFKKERVGKNGIHGKNPMAKTNANQKEHRGSSKICQ